MSNPRASQPSLPVVWPPPKDHRAAGQGGQRVPFDPLTDKFRGVGGIVSDIDDEGVTWLRDSLQRGDHTVRMILAVYPGCPTRTRQLLQLLDIQSELQPRIQFRVFPMTDSAGAPANCLVANPKDQSGLVLLFGTTPNFGLPTPDQTHLNLVFRADQALSEAWIPWFDGMWEQAAPLNHETAHIPPLVPVAGSKVAAARWRDYCDLCLPQKELKSASRLDEDSDNTCPHSEGADESNRLSDLGKSGQLRVSDMIGLRTIDQIASRISILLSKGMQIATVRGRGIAPLEFPISPKFFDQSAEFRDGNVIHRQSFRISAFSKKELAAIERYRRASRTIINRMGLPLETGIYWMPSNVIALYKKEAQLREEKAQLKLSELIGDSAQTFVENKRDDIAHNLAKTYRRINQQGSPSEGVLQEVLDGLVQRIKTALNSSILAPVTYSSIAFDLRETNDPLEAPWAQVEKLILNLARFPRKALCDPKVFNELTSTSFQEILLAMDIADDKIIKLANKGWIDAVDKSTKDLKIIERIACSNMPERSRCQAYFMIIDAVPDDDLYRFIEQVRPDE